MPPCSLSLPPTGRPASFAGPVLAVALVAVLSGCANDEDLTGPDLKEARSPALSVSPASLDFVLPGAAPATVTVTTQNSSEITATGGTCATVTPPTVVTTRAGRNSAYTATFTVAAAEAGTCSVRFTDKKGRQATVGVTVRQLVIDPDAKPVAAGQYHTCALGAGGVAYCWGENDNGRLGDGTTDDRMTPTPVSTEETFTSIVAAVNHTCAISTVGHAWCWGANGAGQLGNPGAGLDSPLPVPVVGPGGGSPLSFVQLTAGTAYTCGLTADGGAWCWGRGSEGQLGDGSLQEQPAPVAVAATTPFGTLAAGHNHTCGLDRTGAAWCWGANDSGQLGDGTTTFQMMPAPVSGGHRFIALAAGGSPVGPTHTCAVTAGNATYCWGANADGQLGDGTTTDRLVPTLLANAAFVRLDGGGLATCALAAGGAASCWGDNSAGQLGTGDFTDRSTPASVVGPGGGAPLAFQSIVAGLGHACGRTVTEIYCWGTNVDGQIAQGGGGLRPTPTLVSLGGARIASLTLESTSIQLEGGTGYRSVITNPGADFSGILQGVIYQGDVNCAAGGTGVAAQSGRTVVDFGISASNQNSCTGTLEPGPATYVLQLLAGDGTELDSRSVAITLTSAP